ncbi:hypothetical protein LCGC14_0753580 [marine sediment metagenome]|uniref:Uncharacterized protein n=1 Tax=marine sediment metagenome TaxID=412755 RepID=A0A0F9SNF0_9ZZZZ|nr:hypothetical protein [archaeon]
MSVKFRKFITRVGQQSEFKPLKNKLLNYLKKESENKYKKYPRLLELMQKYWPQYKPRSAISHLLKDHHEEIFSFYLSEFFHFRKRGLFFSDPEAPTPVDFKLVFKYHYNEKEIDVLEDVMQQLNIEAKTESILKRVFIFAISSFGFMVEQVFGRPFAFQFFDISANSLPNNEWEVIAIISGREQ